jgi:hypothetical protein
MRYIKNYNLFENNSELYQVVSNKVYDSKIEGIVPISQKEIDIINDIIQEKFEYVSVQKSSGFSIKSPKPEEEFYLDLNDIYIDLSFFKDHDEWYYVFLRSYDPYEDEYHSTYKCDEFMGLLEFLKKEILN